MYENIPKILIVEGSVQTADLLTFLLRAEDLHFIHELNGTSALAKLSSLKPDIVVIDVHLPDMSGFDLCRMVKNELESTLVMCVSAADAPNNRMRAEQMGADDYIETNAEQYLFTSKIRSLLRVKRLSDQLRERYKELEEKDTIINKQIEMGMQVQRALIPEINKTLQGCSLLSRFYPAIGVGGDFYNVMPLSDDRFIIVMGDVSGHGIAAAFLTALLNMMIKNISISNPEPDILLSRLNNEVHAMFEKSENPLYACIFYALVDTKKRMVTYANAGQSLPLHVDMDDNSVEELNIAGMPIGLMKDSNYNTNSILYNPSDLLLLHTDGLQDIFYKGQPDEFTHRITEMLSEMRNGDDMEAILDAICNQFYNSTASEKERLEMDDVSMILCRFN